MAAKLRNKILNGLHWAIPVVLVVIVGILFWVFIGKWIFLSIRERDRWKESTTPLTAETKQDVCETFMFQDARICEESAVIYSPEISPEIRNYFLAKSGPVFREDVEEKLGKYLIGCEEPIYQADGTNYFVCDYDLAGDRVFPISIFYFTDGTLIRMHNSTDP